jgi:predicted AAA+ superfamily ATPase
VSGALVPDAARRTDRLKANFFAFFSGAPRPECFAQRKMPCNRLKRVFLPHFDIFNQNWEYNVAELAEIWDVLLVFVRYYEDRIDPLLQPGKVLSKQTVARYLDLLVKAFVICKVRGFSRSLRKEVAKTCRYYFLDNGVRNAVINIFNPISRRNDVGQLWENFVFTERMKKREYHAILRNVYFWRTYDRQEIDLVEARGGGLYGFEIKYRARENAKAPKDWIKTYSNAEYSVVTLANYRDFVA